MAHHVLCTLALKISLALAPIPPLTLEQWGKANFTFLEQVMLLSASGPLYMLLILPGASFFTLLTASPQSDLLSAGIVILPSPH